MFKLAVVTPCSRPENLPQLYESLLPGRAVCDLTWTIVYDDIGFPPGPVWLGEPWVVRASVPGGAAGKRQINLALEHIPADAWVWVLDDDNLAHPAMFAALDRAIREQPDKRGFLLAQARAPGRVDGAHNVRVHYIDQAQYVVRRDLIGDRRYDEVYAADGLFIEKLVAEAGDEFGRLDDPLVYYNRLTWEEEHVM